MTGLAKTVLIGPGRWSRALQGPRTGGNGSTGQSGAASQQEAGERREETKPCPLIPKVRAILTEIGDFAFRSLKLCLTRNY